MGKIVGWGETPSVETEVGLNESDVRDQGSGGIDAADLAFGKISGSCDLKSNELVAETVAIECDAIGVSSADEGGDETQCFGSDTECRGRIDVEGLTLDDFDKQPAVPGDDEGHDAELAVDADSAERNAGEEYSPNKREMIESGTRSMESAGAFESDEVNAFETKVLDAIDGLRLFNTYREVMYTTRLVSVDISAIDLSHIYFLIEHAMHHGKLDWYQLIEKAYALKERLFEVVDGVRHVAPDDVESPNLDQLIDYLTEKYRASYE